MHFNSASSHFVLLCMFFAPRGKRALAGKKNNDIPKPVEQVWESGRKTCSGVAAKTREQQFCSLSNLRLYPTR